jgi:hypothetical protein
MEQKVKKVLVALFLFISLLLGMYFVVRLFFNNNDLINKIDLLEKEVKDRDTQVKLLEEDIKNKKIEIIEKERIIYKDGKLIIPEDYEELKHSYIVLSEVNQSQKELILKLEEKSSIDDKLIIDLSDALEESKKEIIRLSKKEFLSSSILLGANFDSIDVSYILLINERFYIGVGGTSKLSAKVYVGVKL